MTLFLAILPIYLIGNYYYKKDTVKEPKKLLQKLFFGGILSTIIVIIISIISFIVFPKYITTEGLNHFELLIYSFIFIAFVEELSKWLVIYKIAYNHQDFDQYFDIILYSVFVGLGFACLENILYVFKIYQIKKPNEWKDFCFPFHQVFFQLIMINVIS